MRQIEAMLTVGTRVAGDERRRPVDYEIRIRGRLGKVLEAEFARLDVTARTVPVETTLECTCQDRSALHEVLRHIEGLGLEVVEMRGSFDDGR